MIYLSTDQPNRSFVWAWGREHGYEVEFPESRHNEWDRAYDGLLLDLDHVSPGWLETLARLLQRDRREMCPIAVHGNCDMVDAFLYAFQGRRMIVSSRLCSELLEEFVRDLEASDPESVENSSGAPARANLTPGERPPASRLNSEEESP